MSWILLPITLLLAICLWRKHRQTAKLTEQIEHFLLYPEEPLRETLSEGSMANLQNQFSRMQQLLFHQREQALLSDRQMTQFVENMAHQMKNTLTALQIQMDISQGKLDPAQHRKQQLCMQRLTDEVDRLLRSSQLAAGKVRMRFASVDLRAEVEACMERLTPLAQLRKVELSADVPKLSLSADSFWLSQALENLLKNAVEHAACRATVTCRDMGTRVCILVADDGSGIAPEDFPQLFVRFHRGSGTKSGYGIGLSMAKDIAEAHHGTLTARNGSPGAVFELELPNLQGAKPYQ